MVESESHKFIKERIAEALRELGYHVKTEARVAEGRADVLALKDGEEVRVEVYKTNIPWFLVRIKGDIKIPYGMADPPTTRVVAYQAGKYLRTSIPSEIVAELGLKAGDVLAWEVVERGGRKVALIRKLE